MQKTDLIFLKRFAQVIGVLFVIMIFLIIGANWVNEEKVSDNINPERKAALLERIEPVSDVYAGETGRAAIVTAQAAAQQAMAASVAFDGALDGALIYNNVCSACHNTGAGGAPNTKESWAPRFAQGLDVLIQRATTGFQGASGIMPAKGGRPDLNDEQVKVTVEYILEHFK